MRFLSKTAFSLALLMTLAAPSFAADGVELLPLGDLEILVLRDANVQMAKQLLPELDKNAPEFAPAFANGPLPAVVQTFVLQKGPRRVLVDAGWGRDLKVQGRTAELLQEAGIAPEEITDILLTHMDWDHTGGLLDKGKPRYPNAVLWVSRPEYAAWIGGQIQRPREAVELAQKAASLYPVKQFDYGDEILPGVMAVDASGHTPGHTAFDVASGPDKLTIAGDILHLAPIQLARPDLSSVYDLDPAKAALARKRLLGRAADEKAQLAGMHFPMISTVRKAENNGFLMKQPR